MPVRHAILGLLEQEPRHGYELRAAFEALVGGSSMWDLRPAQVYTTLNRLEDAGLVECSGVMQAGGPEKRVYALTADGRKELRGWLAAPLAVSHQRDAFFLKLMIALACGGDPAALVRIQRAHMYRELHLLTEHRSGLDPETVLAHVLLHDKAVMHLEADLRWLEMVEARLEDMSAQPVPQPPARPRGRPVRLGIVGESGRGKHP